MAESSPFLVSLCELDAELQLGITITRDDITQAEFLALRILNEERDKLKARRQAWDQSVDASRAAAKPQEF